MNKYTNKLTTLPSIQINVSRQSKTLTFLPTIAMYQHVYTETHLIRDFDMAIKNIDRPSVFIDDYHGNATFPIRLTPDIKKLLSEI